jgi:hypothetical protein
MKPFFCSGADKPEESDQQDDVDDEHGMSLAFWFGSDNQDELPFCAGRFERGLNGFRRSAIQRLVHLCQLTSDKDISRWIKMLFQRLDTLIDPVR